MKHQTLTTLEVAKKLSRSVRQVNYMVRQGNLSPCGVEGRSYLFDLEQIETYMQLRAQGAGPARVAGWAIQAKAAVAALERKVEAVYEILGLHTFELDLTGSGVSRLYEMASSRMKIERESTSQEIASWARILHSIDTPYLELVSHIMVDREPWKVFLGVADTVKKGVSRVQLTGDPAYERAFRALLHARNQVRTVAYLFAQPRLDRPELALAFNDQGIDREVLSLIGASKQGVNRE